MPGSRVWRPGRRVALSFWVRYGVLHQVKNLAGKTWYWLISSICLKVVFLAITRKIRNHYKKTWHFCESWFWPSFWNFHNFFCRYSWQCDTGTGMGILFTLVRTWQLQNFNWGELWLFAFVRNKAYRCRHCRSFHFYVCCVCLALLAVHGVILFFLLWRSAAHFGSGF